MPQTISETARLLHLRAVDVRPERRLADVDAAHEPGPIGQKPSWPFTRSIEPASVSRKSCAPTSLAQAKPARWSHTSLGAHAAHRPTDDGGDLALVVEEPAVRRAHELAAVRVDRRRAASGSTSGARSRGRAEFVGARAVVQVDADDGRGSTGGA